MILPLRPFDVNVHVRRDVVDHFDDPPARERELPLVTAHDGLAAVEAAATLDPDVILLDIGLPVLNGYQAARRIREQQGKTRRPLLVALTGWGQEEDRRRSQESGFDAHLVKPVDHAVLTQLLEELGADRQEVRE